MTKVSLDNTLGAAFLGTSASCILFGITVVQTHFYYVHYPNDWQRQKISVAILLTLATLHLILTLHCVYHYLITNFGNQAGLQSIVWSFKLQVVINACMIFCVQGLYVVRVWKIAKHISRFWPVLLGFIVAGGYALGFLLIAKTYETKSLVNLGNMRSVIQATFAVATGIDVVIATTLCYYLNLSRSSFVGTNNKILIAMRYVLISGFLTSACSLSALITYVAMPHSLVFTGIDFLLPNLYVNSYIAMLNARKSMNRRDVSTINVNFGEVTGVRSGLTIQTEGTNLHSVDDTVSPNGIPLSAKKFTSTLSKDHDPEQGIPSMQLGILVHRTDERQYR